MFPYPPQPLKMEHRYEAKYSAVFLRSADAVSSVPADLNDVKELIAHFLIDKSSFWPGSSPFSSSYVSMLPGLTALAILRPIS